ncbi:hypothetical protein [Psychroserpens damuponensis]|uniref:hypothetical protein n=1 Tax=Psychroserpens damuponensis TaxID=943936 RepID=UPI00058FD1D4|nr:hypothetical protein [Psychroserpens damuponensis]
MKTLILFVLMLISAVSFSQVGIGTTTPQSTLDINGSLSVKHIELPVPPSTSTAAQNITDGVYFSLNPRVQDQIFNLPDPTMYPGRIYILRNINNTLTARLTTTSGLLFPKGTTSGVTDVYMYENNSRTMLIISDGSNWNFID